MISRIRSVLLKRITHSPRTYLLPALLLVSSFFLTSAHADPALFQTFTEQDGLASDYVNGIAFGSGNALWVGTPRGATLVQDKYWITYTSSQGLGNNWVSGIGVASGDKSYFATDGGGLTVFDGGSHKTYNTTTSAIPSDYLTGLAVDKQNRVWVGTLGAGVGRLEGEQWATFTLPDNYVNALALDAAGNPWVATDDGVSFYNGKTWSRFTQTSGLAGNRVLAVAVAPDGRVWFGTDKGATVYDGRRFKSYKQSDGLKDNTVRAIAVDAQKRVWFGTPSGLSVLDGSTWKSYSTADGLADDFVTALAVDGQGNVWVGTPSGLSVFGSVTLSGAKTLPVVLVHGWHGPASDQLEDSEFRFIAPAMEQDGIAPFYAAGILPDKTLFQNAATLRDDIAEVKAKTGSPRVDIIAFSMGGLNARAYLESTLYQNDVRRAIILGTPEAGVDLWYPLLTREIEDRPKEPSTIELSPEYANLFNRTHTPRATVPYDLVVGDARNQPGLELLKAFPPSDGLISEWSAHALNGPQVRHILDSDVHSWNPAPLPFNITSYLYPEQTYTRFIRNGLRDPDARPLGFAAPPVEPVAPRNITPMNVDTLNPGDSVTRTITIDANRTARFFARWDEGDADMSVKAPDGTRYTATAPRDATFLKADIADFIGYSIPHAQAGVWSVTVTRLDKGDQPLTVTTYADLDADLKLDASTDHLWYRPGQPVIVSASLSNHASDADVRAKVEWLGNGVTPRGSPTEVKLLEEGEPGNYAQALTDLRGGYYLLRITARTATFTREREAIFSVSPATAQLTGDVHVRTEGAAGSYSALVVDAGVNAKQSGSFALAATLRNPQKQVVASITAPITLTQGTLTVSVAIPGRDLRARGLDGPYSVDLTLMDASWAAVEVDEAPSAMTTAAYRASDFGQ